MQPLVVSHFTLVTCLGAGVEATVAALRAGRSGLQPCRFEGTSFPAYAGEVEGLDDVRLTGELSPLDCRNNRLAQMALAQDGFEEAVARARGRYGPERIALILGTSTSGILQAERAYRARDPETGVLPADFNYAGTHNTFSVARFAARYLGLEGPAVVISAACASTAKVFGSAARMMACGLCDAVIVGGADSLCLTTLCGFRSLELVAEGPCRPFDVDREGISVGEAAGFALLEKAERSTQGNRILLLGVGESSDAYHMSTPHPEGLGARLAMEHALASAGLEAGDIDYINLHGTATRTGDAAEDRAVVGLFGTDTPCSSTKGQTGHTLGAAGIVEAIICALGMEHGFMPGSALTRTVDPDLHCRYLIQGAPKRLERVMSNAFGFGGSNCSLILGRG